MDIEKTKARIQAAKDLAQNQFPHSGDNPVIVAAIVQSLAVDALNETVEKEFRKLGELICQSASVAGGN